LWQGNFLSGIHFRKKKSVAGRLEYFNDEKNIRVISVNPVGGFKTISGGLCLTTFIKEYFVKIGRKTFYLTK
jgi:hypothetical protein